ncbi:hypothetical protein D6789_02950 [Candidatus Woesearchaeota archaeon]|nr:MAG: hypothetical protein D6789_02950 [Candidatus Woesearchaeota archaeon]
MTRTWKPLDEELERFMRGEHPEKKPVMIDASGPQDLSFIEHLYKTAQDDNPVVDYPLVMPDGTLTRAYTPAVQRLVAKATKHKFSRQRRLAKKAIQELERFRQRQGIAEYKKLEREMARTKRIIIQDGYGMPRVYLGPTTTLRNGWVVPDTIRLTNPEAVRVYWEALNLQKEIMETAAGFCVPTSLAFDKEEFEGERGYARLERLLDEENYRRDDFGAWRASAKLRGEHGKAHIVYALNEREGGFGIDVKYTAFGPKLTTEHGGLRDKLDVVVGLNEFGRPKAIHHIEAVLPYTRRTPIDREENEARDLLMEIEFEIQSSLGLKGTELKTDRKSGEQFVNYHYDGLTPVRKGNSEINKVHAQFLLDNPDVLGGEPFARVLAHAREHSGQLKKLYEQLKSS